MKINNNTFFYTFENLWLFLRHKRKKQLLLLLITIFLSGFAEIISLGSFIPFLGALINSESLNKYPIFINLTKFLGIKSDNYVILLFAIIFAIAALIATLTRLINIWYTEKIVAAIGSDFSCDAYKKSLFQPYDIHIQRNSSEIIKTITLQVDTTITVINQTLRMITSAVIFLSILFFLIYTDWQIACVSVISFTSVYGLIIKFSKKILVSNSKKIDISRFKQVKLIQEGFGSIRDVIINRKQIEYLDSYKSVDLPLRNRLAQNRLISNSPRFLIEGISLIFISFLSFFLIEDRGSSSQVIPIIGAIALAAQRMLPALQQIFRSWASIKANSADLEAVFKLLGQKISSKQIYNKVEPFNFSNDVKFKNVYYKYKNGTKYVLRDINLKISKGEMIGIIGETGSGKSSFVDLLMGLLKPSKGNIYIDGQKLNNNFDLLQKWYATISHVPQDLYLNDTSIADNIAFGVRKKDVNYDQIYDVSARAQILDFILSLPNGFDTVIGEKGVNLSGGQRQRISIARSLYKKSSIVIFDEATSALDNKTEALIMKSIENLSKDITIILVAHRISSLKNCSKIFEFDKGKLKNVLTKFEIDQL